MVFTEFLNFIFGPLLTLPSLAAIVILSFVISLISAVITKYATDQTLMKELKDQMKAYQEQVKKLKDNPEAAMDVQKKAMDVNMKYMMHNMRATLFTFLPIILIFGWMSSHLAYAPLLPGQEFSITLAFSEKGKNATLSVPDGLTLTTSANKHATDGVIKYTATAANEGTYLVDVTVDSTTTSHTVVIGQSPTGVEPTKQVNTRGLDSITVDYEPLRVITFPAKLPLLGEYFGWLGTYILTAIAFSMGLRRLLKIH
ncbi:DUF106 domain-containing protein [Candidatus Woesearchaeota archaeon]|nr:DUF106 domain-containing protein [Candidatus Woesearchaeota archaeon]